jgi:RND family efflux transporter MFP subunit
MHIFLSILKDFKIYFNIKDKRGRKHAIILGIVALICLVVWSYVTKSKTAATEPTASLPQVTVLSVGEMAADARFDTIGKVEAISEANLQTETGGRVTAVSVKVGDKISAGAVIASIENSSQRAQLVQAEGAYEAALAGAAQGNVGVSEAATRLTSAQNAAVSTYNTSFNSVNGAMLNTIDAFFGNPNSFLPGVKIDSQGKTDFLNKERIAFQSILSDWRTKSNSLNTNSDLESELKYARVQTDREIAMVDTFIGIFNQSGTVSGYSEAELQADSVSFTNLRASLIGTRSSIDGALSGLAAAKDGVKHAELSAAGGQVSSADAQVKIALGSLQAAQSNYQKTIVRSPISGVVNALYLKTGDYATQGKPAAIVANNGGLQIKTFINEADSANLNVGDAVTIEGTSAGVITAKAAALDPSNGKIAVVVGVNPDSNLTNGATVKVTFAQVSTAKQTDKILIPLAALKITSDGSFVFTLEADTKLKAVPVTQGQLFGDNVEILTGITKESRIITDARGLKDGQLVTLKK